MDKRNIQTYVDIANGYFQEAEEIKELGQSASKKVLLNALYDYYQGQIELIVVAMVASEIYWNRNDRHEIDYYWDPYFSSALVGSEEGDYYLSEEENINGYVENMEKVLRRFWDHENMN